MDELMDEIYKGSLKVIELLMDLDPEPDTVEGRLLIGLSNAVSEYESTKYDK